jgi:3-oxoacyl-[acyl-carrier protein] reductase
MSHSLQGRRALVTASSQGLGFAIARRLAVAGCAVAINARDPVRLREAAEKIGNETVALTADLAVPAQVEGLAADAIAALGGLDLLVVNSGHIPYGTLEDLPDESWYGAFDLLLMSAVRLCRAVAPALRVAGGGNIVFIGSATVRQPSPHLLLSSVMRLGVTGLAKTLARGCVPGSRSRLPAVQRRRTPCGPSPVPSRCNGSANLRNWLSLSPSWLRDGLVS